MNRSTCNVQRSDFAINHTHSRLHAFTLSVSQSLTQPVIRLCSRSPTRPLVSSSLFLSWNGTLTETSREMNGWVAVWMIKWIGEWIGG